MESASVATQPITRICVSVEQMAPLLEKLYAAQDAAAAEAIGADEDAAAVSTLQQPRLNGAASGSNETTASSWNDAVVAGLKESQRAMCILRDEQKEADGKDGRPAGDSRQNHTDPNMRPDYVEAEYGAVEYVNYIDLSEVNPIIEAHMCFQCDELFEGNGNVIVCPHRPSTRPNHCAKKNNKQTTC